MKPGASKDEIKKSFFKLAKKYHPDVNKTVEAKKRYLEITEAYETLSNEQKRKVYDATGMNSNDQQNVDFNFDGFNSFSQMFKSAFTDAQDIEQKAAKTYEEILEEYEKFFSLDPEVLH